MRQFPHFRALPAGLSPVDSRGMGQVNERGVAPSRDVPERPMAMGVVSLGSEIGDALRAQEVRFVGAPTSIDGIDPHELIAQAKTPPTPGAETATGACSIRG